MRTALTNPYSSHDDPLLAYKTIRFSISFRQFPKGVFEEAHKLIDANPEPMWTDQTHTRFQWDWQFAASLADLEHTLAVEDVKRVETDLHTFKRVLEALNAV